MIDDKEALPELRRHHLYATKYQGLCADVTEDGPWVLYREVAAALSELRAEVERLRGLASTCYAGLGAEHDLPEQWLDVLLAAANGVPFSTDGLLPYRADPSASNGKKL